MEKDITHNQEQLITQRKDTQIYEAISNFIKDKDGIHVYRRADKICKAYFLLTQHIQNSDSIRLKLRALALDMSSKTLDLVASINKTDDLARDVVMKAMALVSVSDIAVGAHSISPTNFSLVVGQVQIFIEEVETYWKTMSYNNQAIPTHLFEMDTLDASYKNSRTLGMDDVSDEAVNSSFSRNMEVSFNKETITTRGLSTANQSSKIKKEFIKKVGNPTSQKDSGFVKSSLNPQVTGVKDDRQTLILSTIKSKGESSIKDLTDVIKGCSEKTIQRELIALVSSGDLLKTGERRWSRYTVAI